MRVYTRCIYAVLLLLIQSPCQSEEKRIANLPAGESGGARFAEDTLLEYLLFLADLRDARSSTGEPIDIRRQLVRRIFAFWYNNRYGCTREIRWQGVHRVLGLVLVDAGVQDDLLRDPLGLNQKVKEGRYLDPSYLQGYEAVMGFTLDKLRDRTGYFKTIDEFAREMRAAKETFQQKNPNHTPLSRHDDATSRRSSSFNTNNTSLGRGGQ